MNRERLGQFHSRFGIESDEDALKRFQVRVVHAVKASLQSIGDRKLLAQLENEFAFRNASQVSFEEADLWGSVRVRNGIIEVLQGSNTFLELIERSQQLLWTFEALGLFEQGYRYSAGEAAGHKLAAELRKAIELSPDVDVRLQMTSSGAEFVRAGIEFMDDVVDRATQWLAQYPDVRKEFRQAQSILAEKKRTQYRQAQDSLRFALEKLLKLLLSNDSPLERQGKNLKTWLAERGVTKNLRDVAVRIMDLITQQYQNPVVKHDNAVMGGNVKGWADYEVEYILYQHATLFRLLIEASEHGAQPDTGTAQDS
ncbi:MAG: hypothetical protein ACJ76N_14205 [Thermoanaerobaculia bacterium]